MPLKVTLLSASLSRNAGGLLPSLQRLSQSLHGSPRVQVTVLGLRDEHSEADLSGWRPLRPVLFDLQLPRKLGYAPQLRKHLEAGDSSLFHTHGLWLYPSAAVSHCHRRRRTPYMVTPHGMLDPWALRNSRWKKRIAGWLFEDAHLRGAACLHALGESEAHSIRAYGLKNPIAIIPNGIDLPDSVESSKLSVESSTSSAIALRSPLSALHAAGRKILLYLGRLHPKKGLANLLKAWKLALGSPLSTLHSAPGEWVLALAGWDQGGHEDELKRLATELGIPWADVREAPPSPACPGSLTHPLSPTGGEGARRAGEGDSTRLKDSMRARMPEGEVSNRSSLFSLPSSNPPSLLFLGPLFGADKAAAYRACDAFILPSFSEGLPMVVLEAWAYGKAVLMTPECNLPEGFAANAAIRIDPNPESIAEGLRQMIELSNRTSTSPLAPLDNPPRPHRGRGQGEGAAVSRGETQGQTAPSHGAPDDPEPDPNPYGGHPRPHRGRGQGEGVAGGNSFHAELPPATVDLYRGQDSVLRIPLAPIGGEGQGEGALRGEMSSPLPGSLLLAPCSELAALGSAGRQLVATRFAWPQIARDMLGVYEWVLGGGPKPDCVIT